MPTITDFHQTPSDLYSEQVNLNMMNNTDLGFKRMRQTNEDYDVEKSALQMKDFPFMATGDRTAVDNVDDDDEYVYGAAMPTITDFHQTPSDLYSEQVNLNRMNN